MKQNIFTGDNPNFYNEIKNSIKNAESVDIIVSFLMESGVKLIINELKSKQKIRILTSDYLNITQPQALYILKQELGDNLDLRFYNNPNKSFHPKAYIFHNKDDSEIYVGSSNMSKSALTDSIEWNYHFTKSEKPEDFTNFQNNFEDLFSNHSLIITDDILKDYSKSWIKPKFSKVALNEKYDKEFKPNPPQIEALYLLNQSRLKGYDKGLVVATTGIGKTYLAAFDTKNYDKILFVAHREEIIKQASETFKVIHPKKTQGFFYNAQKDTDKDITFALVQTLGRNDYLNENHFKRNEFDYIIIDEFHHAVSKNYKNILNYFTPKFMLGLTATPERLDNKDVFALCDYNVVYEIRLKQAINKGFLSPFKYYGIYDDTVNYEDISIRNGNYDEKELEKKLMIHKRADLVLKHYLKYSPNSTIGFCSSRNHAEFMAEYFNHHNIPSAAVYSGNQGEHTENRSSAITKLKNHDLKVLFTVDMFNEGVDIPEIDSVLFLRPTQSPTIFLQQLGRGLRKSENKTHLIVLDFIGNYKKANFVPFLLSDTEYNTKTLLNESVINFEYPEDCYIDFDFKLVDLFKIQARQELNVKDIIYHEFNSVKNDLNHRPSRLELFLRMDENVISNMKSKPNLNLFRDYLTFLSENNELESDEKHLINTVAHEFLNTLETTSMTKSYKMPILKAFYNNGNIKMEITDDEVYNSMKEFYSIKSNGVDMLKHKSTENYQNWGKKEYVSLAKRNPIKYLMKTHSEFFIKKEGCALALNSELESYIHLETFKKHFKDIIEYRTMSYYKERNLK